jgi:3-oxoacyl-[acyl-carrier-protein] synthase II
MTAFVTGIGWVAAGGHGMGRNADPFDLSHGALPRLGNRIPFVSPRFRRLGRLDKFSMLGLRAIAYALKDAELDEWDERREIGVIASTVFGCLSTDMDFYDTVLPQSGLLADPNLFAHTLPNTFLGHASIVFGLTGPDYVINDMTGSGLAALSSALECISMGEADTMLAGICDVECPHGIIESNTAPGAVFLVLEKTLRKDSKPYGSLSVNKNGALLFDDFEITYISEIVKKSLTLICCSLFD